VVAGINAGTILRVRAAGAVEAADSRSVGGLVGSNAGTIERSHAAVAVEGANGASVGGLAGGSGGTITQSSASGPAKGTTNGTTGGLVGSTGGTALISQSYATGPVDGGSARAGGLVGQLSFDASVTLSFATGPVKTTSSDLGGLIGRADGTVTRSFSTGIVHAVGACGDCRVGGLIGFVNGGTVTEAYTASRLDIDAAAASSRRRLPPTVGGCFGVRVNYRIEYTYLDRQTSQWPDDDPACEERTTAQLQQFQPAGFDTALWGITPNVSYPFLRATGIDFRAPLATTVFGTELFTFVPISQLDPAQYNPQIVRKDLASKASAYAIIARAIGRTRTIAALENVSINQYWNGAQLSAVWRGAVTSHATLGSIIAIAPATPLGASNVIPPLRTDKLVLLRGSYNSGGAQKTHWLLATSFRVTNAGTVTAIVADDPWTGLQVTVHPSTKAVTAPGFPLAGFNVNAYQVVTLTAG
jgi:hypothetical protein